MPFERRETVRKEIIAALAKETLSAKEISAEVRIPEREVYTHLGHIQKSLTAGDHRLVITPAECVHCGFVFKKRDRLSKPGKCPVCRHEQIREPLFTIAAEND